MFRSNRMNGTKTIVPFSLLTSSTYIFKRPFDDQYYWSIFDIPQYYWSSGDYKDLFFIV